MSEADMLKEINNILSGSYSELGIGQWWSRARVELAEAEFAEFKIEWDRLVALHPNRVIGSSGQNERVWVDNLCIESKIDTWVKRWPKWFRLSPIHVFRLQEVHAR